MGPAIKYYLLLFAGITIYVNCFSQDSAFTYHNKPISAAALIPFFGYDFYGNGITNDTTVDLTNDTLSCEVGVDSAKLESEWWGGKVDWVGCGLGQDPLFGFIDYAVVGKISSNTFVILSRFNTGGRQTDAEVFILAKKGDKLHKVGGFMTLNIRDYPVVIGRNEIVNGEIHYKIPK